MFLLDSFTDWRKNRNPGAGTRFGGTFSPELHPMALIPAIKKILSDNIDNYYVQIDESIKIPLGSFNEERISFDIHTDLELPIEMIFVRRNVNFSENNTMISVGLSNKFSIDRYRMFEKLILNEQLILGCFEEQDYLFWQNCTGVSAYKYKGGLKYSRNNLGKKIVDVTNRPGRSVFNKKFRYAGSSKMWFGPQIYQYIPQEKVLGFEGAVEIEVLEHNITFLNLYETVYDGDAPNNQEIQRRFRKQIGIDELKIE